MSRPRQSRSSPLGNGKRAQGPGQPPLLRTVTLANRYPRLQLDRRGLIRAIHVLDTHHATLAVVRRSTLANTHELSLAFLTDSALAGLHADFLADPSTTDVITFEGDPTLGFAGEICVSVDTAAAYARKHRRNFREELLLYVVHGWLHLAGHDDLQPAKKRLMRRVEARALRLLRAARCIPRLALASSVTRRRTK